MIAPWAKAETATADFGDERLVARLVKLLSAMASRPTLSIPAAWGGWAETQAAYRFFDNDKTSFERVLQPHIERSRERVAAQPVVLLIQDTSEIDLTRPEQQVAGAGDLEGSRRGFLLHQRQAFTPASIPLGTVWAEVVKRTEGVSPASPAEKREERKRLPIEEKESLRWLTGRRPARELAQPTPATPGSCVGDSEADIYELVAEARGERPVDWLIRAGQDRAVQGPRPQPHLREQVLSTPVLYEVELLIRGRQAKTAAEDRARRQNRATRRAPGEVRAATLTVRAPPRADRKLPPVTVPVVLVSEVNPPPGETPVEWILVTTLPIDTAEPVRTVVEYYCVRWTIEIFFRTRKAGGRIEKRRFEEVERVLPCLGVCLIVAWRILFVCRLARECPDLDCEAVFEPSEWKAVWVTVHRKKAPRKGPRLAEMVHLIASLGGYMERPNSEPGTQTMWIGIQRMYDLAWVWDTFGPQGKIRSS